MYLVSIYTVGKSSVIVVFIIHMWWIRWKIRCNCSISHWIFFIILIIKYILFSRTIVLRVEKLTAEWVHVKCLTDLLGFRFRRKVSYCWTGRRCVLCMQNNTKNGKSRESARFDCASTRRSWIIWMFSTLYIRTQRNVCNFQIIEGNGFVSKTSFTRST